MAKKRFAESQIYRILQENEAGVPIQDLIKKYGADHEVSFPNTAYYLPVIYSMLGAKVEKLGDQPLKV